MNKRIIRHMPPVEYIPFLILFLLFYVFPLIHSVIFVAGADNVTGFSFSNLIQSSKSVLTNPFFLLGLKNNLEISLVQTGTTIVLGIIISLALWMSSKAIMYLKWLILPALIPTACIVILWTSFQRMASGNSLLSFLGIQGSLLDRMGLYSLFLWRYLGLAASIFTFAIYQQPYSVFEAARLDGATTMQLLRYIILPLMAPVIAGVTIFLFSLSLRVFRESWLMYGEYPSERLYSTMNYMHNHFRKLNYQSVATASVLFTLIITLITVFFMSLVKIGRRLHV